MSTADEVLKAMCQSYSSAVNASDAATYAKLFTQDAIRMPPGAQYNVPRKLDRRLR
jgi:ketosteroid isomerase-like protein